MTMEFFRFELVQQLRSPLMWLLACLFGLLAFGAASTDAVQVGGAIGNVYRNAPIVTLQFFTLFTIFGMLIIGMSVASAMLRDFEAGTADLLFATPMKKHQFLLGRFAAALVSALLVYLVIASFIFVAQFMPWIDAKRLGPVSLTPTFYGLAVLTIPNVLFTGAVLTWLAVSTRSILWVYIGILGFLVLYFVGQAFIRNLDNLWLVSMLDPFGLRALSITTRYWSAEERNVLLPVSGYLFANRALWMVLSLLIAGLAFKTFKTERLGTGRGWFKTKASPLATVLRPSTSASTVLVNAVPSSTSVWRQCLAILIFDVKGILKSVPFLVMLLFGMANFIPSALLSSATYDTKIYLTTAQTLQAMNGSFTWLLMIIVLFYAGELVFKERQAKLNDVIDAMPTPNWQPLLAKFAALIVVVGCFQLVGACIGAMLQLAKGGAAVDIALYIKGCALNSIYFVLLGGLALVLQVYSNNKFIGYGLMISVLVVQVVAGFLDYTHNLYQYGNSPAAPYSDMNGYGHFWFPKMVFNGYWALCLIALLCLAAAFWVRGHASTRRERFAQAKLRLRGPLRVGLAASLAAFVAIGSYIFYNTNVLNTHRAPSEILDNQARYEREFKKYLAVPQPRILAVDIDVDLRPMTQSMSATGHYRIGNPHAMALKEIHVSTSVDDKYLEAIGFGSTMTPLGTISLHEPDMRYRIYQLTTPMQPGEERDLYFRVSVIPKGFTNEPESFALVENGSFFNSSYFPRFGYNNNVEIADRADRRKRQLGEPERMHKLEDEAARQNTYISDNADWIDFKTSICTEPDQIALAPGYLQREYNKDGRRCFSYAMDRPMLNFYAYLSARWQVKKATYNNIPIEVYYDAKHPYNVDRMIESVQKSLGYFEANFSPYQHKQVRIIEFPGYAAFAQAFANTIPYSEDIGFIADLRKVEAIDYVFYVTAHEIAHQWWAHQVIGADVQGSTVLSESLSQYSALMVMEKQYGREKMRKFLKYELDGYLTNRSGEVVEELPLYRNENQGYIHYRKGSLVFYRLREDMGEAALNRALSKFIADHAFKGAPYPRSVDLIGYLRAEAGPEVQPLITDLFEKISFYDNRVLQADAVKQADGQYLVTIKAQASKRYSDGIGKETDAPLDDSIEVGVYAGSGDQQRTLHLRRERITTANPEFKVVVAELPTEVGFDPDNKLIDKVSRDNRKSITLIK